MKSMPTAGRQGKEIYRFQILHICGEEFRISDQGQVIAFSSQREETQTKGLGKDHSDREGHLIIRFTPTQYKIIKQLILHLETVVSFAELIATYQPTYHPDTDRRDLDYESIRALSRTIYTIRKKLPSFVLIRNEYDVGYMLQIVQLPHSADGPVAVSKAALLSRRRKVQ